MEFGEQNSLNPKFIDTLISLEGYLVQPLLDARAFVDYCKSREVGITIELLEKLEETGQFFPLVRIAPPEIILKIEWTEGRDAYRVCGELQEGETWLGDTQIERANVIWHQPFLLEWCSQGLVWEPDAKPFQPWKSYIEAGRQAV